MREVSSIAIHPISCGRAGCIIICLFLGLIIHSYQSICYSIICPYWSRMRCHHIGRGNIWIQQMMVGVNNIQIAGSDLSHLCFIFHAYRPIYHSIAIWENELLNGVIYICFCCFLLGLVLSCWNSWLVLELPLLNHGLPAVLSLYRLIGIGVLVSSSWRSLSTCCISVLLIRSVLSPSFSFGQLLGSWLGLCVCCVCIRHTNARNSSRIALCSTSFEECVGNWNSSIHGSNRVLMCGIQSWWNCFINVINILLL